MKQIQIKYHSMFATNMIPEVEALYPEIKWVSEWDWMNGGLRICEVEDENANELMNAVSKHYSVSLVP